MTWFTYFSANILGTQSFHCQQIQGFFFHISVLHHFKTTISCTVLSGQREQAITQFFEAQLYIFEHCYHVSPSSSLL